MRLESSSEFEEVIAKLNNSESLDPSHRIMISTRPIDMGVLVKAIKDTKHNVIELTINSIKLTEDEIKKLEDVFTHCALLESLDLSNNDLTSKEAEILAGILANNKTIKSLSLNNNKIGDNGLKAFAKIAENSSIENLNFSDNNISDRGFKYWLAAHKKNSNLVEFHFDNNKIHNEGIQTLIHFLKFNDSVKSFHVGTEQVEEPNTTNVTLETHRLLTKLVEEKEIEAFLKTSDTLLPDALDVWVEDRIPEPEPQQPVNASSVSPTISNYTEAGSVTNETTPQQEIVVENKFNSETLELLDKYNSKFYSLLEGYNNSLDKQSTKPNSALKEAQAVIVFGNSTNDKNILTNLLAHKTLKLENSGGKLIIASSSSKFSQDIILSNKPVINIIKGADGLIVCDSNYPNDNLSKSEATVNALYLQKILRNDTKFVFTVADSETKFTSTRDYEKEFLGQVKKLAILLEKTKLTENNFSFVVTGPLAYREKDDISVFIDLIHYNYAPKLRSCNEEEKSLVRKELQIMSLLKTSTCIVPAFFHGELTLGSELKTILNKPTVINKDNKITISSMDMMELLSLQSSIEAGLREGISKLSDKIKTKWEKEKALLFTLKTTSISGGRIVLPNTEALKNLQDIFKKLAGNFFDNIPDNNTKFLALNNALYNVLTDKESSELNVKLSSYIDYLKYFTAISADNRENISTNMHDNWFKMLADEVGDINKQLVESFKTAIQNSFCCRLETFVKEFSSSTKILTEDTISNIYSLKLLQSILTDKDIKAGIKSFAIIEDILLLILNITSPTKKLALDLDAQMVKNNIEILNDLIKDPKPEILIEIWQGFIGSVSVNTNIDEIIYNKLLTAEIPYKMDIRFYNKLLELISLKDVESVHSSNSHIKAHYSKLAEIYCKMGSVSSDGTKIFESYTPEVIGSKEDFDPDSIG